MAAALTSWVPGATPSSGWGLQNLPWGVFTTADNACPRIGSRLGDFVVDVSLLAARGFVGAKAADALAGRTLNAFMALGRPAWREVRARLHALFSDAVGADSALRDDTLLAAAVLIPVDAARMLLPAAVGDYTDFYSSRDHAYNVGVMFRGPANALQPNWLHLPVGYHGRSSSIVVSGTSFRRPHGQLQASPDDPTKGSIFGPSKQMDFELEMATYVGTGNALGEPIPIADADDHIFGFSILNDWSARDIQKWEYVPLGPFGGKNFCTTVSPWIVTLDALEPFKCEPSSGPQVEPVPLPYLCDPSYCSYDVHLEISLKVPGMSSCVISRSNFKHMYWNSRQQLVHHTITGCNMNPGDVLGSGTISGPEPGTYGSMLELAWKGTKPITLSDGSTRVFLKDGDEVIMKGFAERDGVRIDFGECSGVVLPSVPLVFPAVTTTPTPGPVSAKA